MDAQLIQCERLSKQCNSIVEHAKIVLVVVVFATTGTMQLVDPLLTFARLAAIFPHPFTVVGASIILCVTSARRTVCVTCALPHT